MSTHTAYYLSTIAFMIIVFHIHCKFMIVNLIAGPVWANPAVVGGEREESLVLNSADIKSKCRDKLSQTEVLVPFISTGGIGTGGRALTFQKLQSIF